MSNGTGGAVQNSANFDDISKLFASAKKQMREDANAHDKRMTAYAEKTVEHINDSTATVLGAIEKNGKQTLDAIAEDGKQTRGAIADTFNSTMAAIKGSHETTNNKLDTLVHRTKSTTGDIIFAIIAGIVGFFAGWNIAGLNTTLFPNMLAFGILGLLIGFFAVIAITGFARGFYEKKAAENGSPAASPTPDPDPEPVKPKPATKPDPKPEPKPEPKTEPTEEEKPAADPNPDTSK